MARSFLSCTLALATATLVLFGVGAAPSSAQPLAPTTPTAAAKEKAYPEVIAAFQLLMNTRNMPNAIKALDDAVRKYPELPRRTF